MCPKCGMEAISGSGFSGSSKPYCSFCGWNLQAAKNLEQESIRGLPKSLLFFAAFLGAFGFLFKTAALLFPFLLVSVFVIGSAIASWRKLKLLEASHPAAAYTRQANSVEMAKQGTEEIPGSTHHHLWSLSKPRRVRLKPVARVISIALPFSWIFIAYFGYQIVRDQIGDHRRMAGLGNLAPLLVIALAWSVIGLTTIRNSRKDRQLLAEGELAMATVTHQKLTGGKHRQSKIRYEFKDAGGRLIESEGTDDSRELYEDMKVPVFYNRENPNKNVAICSALCKLKTD
jgi:hypothetical protein